jgi:hypothetical protein
MAVPTFGFLKIEALACLLMIAAGVTGLFVAFTGRSDWIMGVRWSKWVLPHVSIFWLIPQSLLVIARRSRSLAQQVLCASRARCRCVTHRVDAGGLHLVVAGRPHAVFDIGQIPSLQCLLASMARARSTAAWNMEDLITS